MEMAITRNLFEYAAEIDIIVLDCYKDKSERQIIGKIDITKEQYEKLLNISEEVGGFICEFNPNLSLKLRV